MNSKIKYKHFKFMNMIWKYNTKGTDDTKRNDPKVSKGGMKMINRAIVIVLDGFGVGELPDADTYGDVGSNTLKGIYDQCKPKLPNMKKLGLYNIDDVGIQENEETTIGAYGKLAEKSVRKK